MTLQPGQSLSAEDCKLLERGDWLLHDEGAFQFVRIRDAGQIVVNAPVLTPYDNPEAFTFLGRPGADGFIPWTGGENPLPGAIVAVKFRNGDIVDDLRSNLWGWGFEEEGDCIIIAWRPAPSVEGLGDPDLQKMQISDGALRATPSVPSLPVSDSADRRIAALEHEIDLLNEERKFWRRIERVRPKRDRFAKTDYERELYSLWQHAVRQRDVWRGIASAMGYEPNAHEKVKPTDPWLLERIAKYRAALSASGPAGGGGDAHEVAVGRLTWAANTHPDPKKKALLTEWAEECRAALSAPGSQKGAGE